MFHLLNAHLKDTKLVDLIVGVCMVINFKKWDKRCALV